MARDFDELLSDFSGHGPYQRWIVLLVLIPDCFFVAMTLNLVLFQMAVPDHWCHIPGNEATLLSEEQWKNLTIPGDSGKYSRCLQYKIEWETIDNTSKIPYTIYNETQECENGWDYDTSEFSTTWATSHDWYCSRSDYSNNVYSASVAGSSIGTLVLPLLSDLYTGRRLMFYISMLFNLVSLPLIWLPYYSVHIILRFISGMGFQSNFQMPYLIGIELVSPDKRDLTSCVCFMAWTAGMCATSLIAWLVPHWDYLALIAIAPSIGCFVYWRYLPESPRWLLAHGRISECADVLMKVAAGNNRPKPSRFDLECQLAQLKNQEKDTNASITQILRYPNLRIWTLLLHLLFITCYISYGVVLLSVNVLSSNFFLSHFVLSIFELPSNIIGWLFVHYLGRRFTLISTILLTGIFSVAACFCLDDKWTLLTIVGFVKLFSTQFIYIITVISTEVLPTPVRSTVFASMVVYGLLAMTACPYALTAGLGEAFPYLLIIGMMLLSLVLAWLIPETIGLPLPQTFQDSEELGSGRPLTTWIHHWNCSKYSKHLGRDYTQEELNPMKASVYSKDHRSSFTSDLPGF